MQYDRTKSELVRKVSQVPSVLALAETAPDATRFGESFRILLR